MAQEAKITSFREFPSVDPKRLGKTDVLITYTLDNIQAFVIQIPKEDATEAKITEALKKDIAVRASWTGKTFQV